MSATKTPVILMGLVEDWVADIAEQFRTTSIPDGPWTGWKYYVKCIGSIEERKDFEEWWEANHPGEFHTNASATKRSPRAQYYFSDDDFAMLVKLTWETTTETR